MQKIIQVNFKKGKQSVKSYKQGVPPQNHVHPLNIFEGASPLYDEALC